MCAALLYRVFPFLIWLLTNRLCLAQASLKEALDWVMVGGDFLESCEWFAHFPESDVPIGAALQTLQLLERLQTATA